MRTEIEMMVFLTKEEDELLFKAQELCKQMLLEADNVPNIDPVLYDSIESAYNGLIELNTSNFIQLEEE